MIRLKEKPAIKSFINPIQDWYESNSVSRRSSEKVRKYENGMLISISNNGCYYETLFKTFKETYISIVKALKGQDYNISKWDVRQLKGDWDGDRIKLPSREELLRVCANETPILICGVHNYKKDDIRSKGKEYSHSHLYLYNIHYHLPSTPIELRNMEGKIEAHLQRYTNIRKRVQGVIRITEVGVGKHHYTDNISPLELYDYLHSPISRPHQENIINYISNNRHLPSIQYPLTTVYLNKRL